MVSKINMTSGPLVRPMIAFALPLIASGILQQSFNAVDIVVAGRFAGPHALAAVGSNGPVIGLMINMFLGLAVGVNVVIANYIGQRNSRGTSAATGASMLLSLVCGVLMVAITQMCADPMLRLLDTPAEVLDDAIEYLRIFALGMPAMIIYNFGAAVLRSIGDTRRPFYSLVAAGIANVGFNFLFVAGMGMGVQGVAWGTVLSNVINAAIIVVILLRERSDVRLVPSKMRFKVSEIAKVCRIGLPAGLQTTVFSISNIFILSAINSFGASASAGSAAALTYEIYCYFVMTAFTQTATAFVGQNYGAGNIERIRRIFRLSLVMCVVASAILNIGLAWGRELFMLPFTDDAEVLAFGCERMLVVLTWQFIASYYEVAGATMRGIGYSMTPALITIFGTCVLRLFWVGFFPADGTFGQLLLIYPVSWALTDAMMFVAMRMIMPRLRASAALEPADMPQPQVG